MDAISQAACDTATLIRQHVPDLNDPTRAAVMFNLCRVTAYRSPLRDGSFPPANDDADAQVIGSAIAYARSKGAE